jgi:hypothetical protein
VACSYGIGSTYGLCEPHGVCRCSAPGLTCDMLGLQGRFYFLLFLIVCFEVMVAARTVAVS